MERALLEQLVDAALNSRGSATALIQTADRRARHSHACLSLVAAARIVLQLGRWRRELRLHHNVGYACVPLNVSLIKAVAIESLHTQRHGRFHVRDTI